MANRFMAGIVGLIGFSVLFPTGNAAAQASGGGGPATAPLPTATSFVLGDGTPGTVPIWTGPGTLGNSAITQDATSGNVGIGQPPVSVFKATVAGSGGTGGVLGTSNANTGVRGHSDNGRGIEGVTEGNSVGVQGTSNGGGYGVEGISTGASGIGVRGTSSSGIGVLGNGSNGVGVQGASTNNHGIIGSTGGSSAQSGVAGFGLQFGVFGSASPGMPPIVAPAPSGVVGNCANSYGCFGVYGYANPTSGYGHGVVGETSFGPDGAGVIGVTHSTGQGVRGASDNVGGIGVVGQNSAGGLAGQFQGDLDVHGNARKPGGGSWSDLSDARLKKSVEPIGNALSQFLQLRGVTYEYKNPTAFHEQPGTHIGMVAQDVEQVFPTWVDSGTDGYKRLTFRGFEAVAVEAVRELDAKVATNSSEANARITDLERQNAELRHAIESLSEIVKTLQQK